MMHSHKTGHAARDRISEWISDLVQGKLVVIIMPTGNKDVNEHGKLHV